MACGQSPGMVANVKVDTGTSDRFAQEEVEEAVDRVKEKFIDFRGCELLRLWYDEDWSNLFIESYMTAGRGSVNGVSRENVIVLLSNFEVNFSRGDGSLNPNSTYYHWSWILIRDYENGPWRVDDWGY